MGTPPANWRLAPDVPVPETMAHYVGGHPLVAQTLARRGIRSVSQAQAFLNPASYHPAPPEELTDLPEAVDRLIMAIRSGETVCVWGDFDVDGQTATALLIQTLQDLNAQVFHYIPNRQQESHGVNLPGLQAAIERGASLILTCDTGSGDHAAIEHARSRGVDVIVTDHHKLPDALPKAHALVSSMRLPPEHPMRSLPGVGVAFKLAVALYEAFGIPDEADKHLDLVALGIVADLATLSGDTRYLLQRGLETLRATERPGLLALMKIAGLNPQHLDEDGIGYGLAPRMNAIGRLGDANVMVEFLTGEDPVRAAVIAAQLEGLNAERRLLSNQIAQAAEEQLAREPGLSQRPAFVLSHPNWPSGVLGLVAGRLAEKYRRPVALVATPEGGIASGSARSVEGVDITAAIASQASLLKSYGGHAMAAGFTLDPEKIPAFGSGLARAVEGALEGVQLGAELNIDFEVPFDEAGRDLLKEVRRLAPFGRGNPALTFASRDVEVKSSRALGRNQNHLRLVVSDADGNSREVFWWFGAGGTLPGERFDLAYQLRWSEFQGEKNVQIVWMDARQREEAPAEAGFPRQVRAIDYRREPQALQRLEELAARPEVAIWREGPGMASSPGHDRTTLRPSPELAIWTVPPGPRELEQALAITGAETVYIFGDLPGVRGSKDFATHLAALLKSRIQQGTGSLDIEQLAGAMAHRRETVIAGIRWLAAGGVFSIIDQQDDRLTIGSGNEVSGLEKKAIGSKLAGLLQETEAYRAYYLRTPPESLLPIQTP